MSARLKWRTAPNDNWKAGPYTVTQWLGYYFATFELDGHSRLEERFKTEVAAFEHCEQHATRTMILGFNPLCTIEETVKHSQRVESCYGPVPS